MVVMADVGQPVLQAPAGSILDLVARSWAAGLSASQIGRAHV